MVTRVSALAAEDQTALDALVDELMLLKQQKADNSAALDEHTRAGFILNDQDQSLRSLITQKQAEIQEFLTNV